MNTEHTKHPCEAVEASADVMKLAQMILSDCGCSTAISDRLQRRVAGRIQQHMDNALGGQQQAEPVALDDDMVLISRGLIGAACAAIDKKRDAPRVLSLLRDVAMSKAAQPPAVAVAVPDATYERQRFAKWFCMQDSLKEDDASMDGYWTGWLARSEQLPAVADQQAKLEEAEHHRDCLARAIRNAAVKAGIIHAEAVVEGPQLLMLADNLGEAAMPSAVAVHDGWLPTGDGQIPSEMCLRTIKLDREQ